MEKGHTETPEEAADKKYGLSDRYSKDRLAFIAGAEWQAERRYSEEEVIQLIIKFNQEIQEVEDVREWFEQFKKK